jgi:hypothetical protein
MHSFVLPNSLFMHTSQTFGTALVSTIPSSMAQARKRAQFLWYKPNTVQKKPTFQRSHYRRVRLKRVSNIRPSQSRQETCGSLRRRRDRRLRPFNIILMTTLCRYTEICAQNGQRSILGSCMTYWDTPIPNKAWTSSVGTSYSQRTIDARFPGISL